jgi:hypothetical protein
MQTFFIIIAVIAYVGVPTALFSGWIHWARSPREKGVFYLLSLTGYALGTLSALLAIGLLVLSFVRGGFPYYDPLLLRFYRWGLSISVISFLIGCAGMWKKGALRWHAPGLATSMLLVWFIWAIGE